jgi:hypothetical protein
MTACGGGTIGYMWVLGQQYNQIAGFKVDRLHRQPDGGSGIAVFSNGSVPGFARDQVGRTVRVRHQPGCPGRRVAEPATNTGQSIALYSVGGDGTLTFQQSYQSQGYVSQWAQMDSSGTYLYVLDKYSPG